MIIYIYIYSFFLWDLPTTRLIDSALITKHHWDTDLKILRFFHGIQELFQAIALEICLLLSMQHFVAKKQPDLIGILIRASYNPYIHGYYNPLYTLNIPKQSGFFHCSHEFQKKFSPSLLFQVKAHLALPTSIHVFSCEWYLLIPMTDP